MKKALVLGIILFSTLQGCMYYYKVQTVKPVQYDQIKLYDSLNKYLVVHYGDSAWHLFGLKTTSSALSGKISDLSADHLKFKTTKRKGGNRYTNTKKHDESSVLDEVHLYIPNSINTEIKSNDSVKIAFATITRAEVYTKAKGRTLTSWLVPALGAPILVGGIFGIIVAVEMSNGIAGGGIYIK